MKPSVYAGCLLGLAVGDAMGVTVDDKVYADICRDYGPAGLRGYDLVNGFAQISTHTQVAAYGCNGLLTGTAKGKKDLLACVTDALTEWAHSYHLPGAPENKLCWISKMPQLRTRRVPDARTLDCFTRRVFGTPEAPLNHADSPGTLAAVIPVGLFFDPSTMSVPQLGQWGSRIVALSHGDPMAFLTGAVLAYTIAGIVQDPDLSLERQFLMAAEAVDAQFTETFPQAAQVQKTIEEAIELSRRPEVAKWKVMEQLQCRTCSQVLAGAVYAILSNCGDFDAAIITAVNHSGRSAAVGALTGAILGAKLGAQELPDFYLECLAPAGLLRELAGDLHNGQPGQLRSRLFDDSWDRKYTHGLPVDPDGWDEA